MGMRLSKDARRMLGVRPGLKANMYQTRVPEGAAEKVGAVNDGTAMRVLRRECDLDLSLVSRLAGIAAPELVDVELGRRRFVESLAYVEMADRLRAWRAHREREEAGVSERRWRWPTVADHNRAVSQSRRRREEGR